MVGVRNAKPELVRLPTSGRLLVQAPRGAWVVHDDGSRRLLGPYRDATWSPHGKFVAAVLDRRTLVALAPDGTVRWEKPQRTRLSFPRWSYEGFRIAYFAASTLRVIVGNGTEDRALAAADAHVAPAWRPGTHDVAFVGRDGAIVVTDADGGRRLWRSNIASGARQLLWSDDGARLAAVTDAGLTVFGAGGRMIGGANAPGREVAAAFRPGSHELALVLALARSSVVLVDVDRLPRGPRRVFEGAGRFSGVAWAPAGRWLVIEWPSADQLVFVRVEGTPRLKAVSDVSRQFRSRSFPTIGGWAVSID